MSSYILTRIDTLQQELETLKRMLIAQNQMKRMLIAQNQNDRPRIRLKGIWKGAEIPDDLLEEARQSLASKALASKALASKDFNSQS